MEKEHYYTREERLADISDRQQIRDLVEDAVESGVRRNLKEKDSYFQPVKDPKMTMRARQELVRRRRELLQRQREMELEHRIACKQNTTNNRAVVESSINGPAVKEKM